MQNQDLESSESTTFLYVHDKMFFFCQSFMIKCFINAWCIFTHKTHKKEEIEDNIYYEAIL